MNRTSPRMLALFASATAAATVALPATAHADDAPINLPLTDEVSAELVAAGAVLTGRPPSEFTGLRPTKSYYAEYPDSGNQWAAAALQADPASYEAGIHLQDQNSYMVFNRSGSPGATWIPHAVGFGAIPAGEAPCPVPAAVRDLWQWPAGKCYPPPG